MSDIPPSGIAHNGPNTDITDDARAVREAAMDLYRAMRRTNPDAWAEVDEVEDWTYWDDIVRTAQVTLAAGRAETTTATTEDAAAAVIDALGQSPFAHHEVIPSGETASTLYVTYDDEWDELASLIVQMLASRGLLATARTRPTRQAIHRAIAENDHEGQAADWYYDNQADSVMALLADRPTEAEAVAQVRRIADGLEEADQHHHHTVVRALRAALAAPTDTTKEN